MKNLKRLFGTALVCSMIAWGCGQPATKEEKEAGAKSAASITEINWGRADSIEVKLFTLTNANGTEVKITNYGGIVTSWKTKDRQGNLANVVLGFDSLSGYMAPRLISALLLAAMETGLDRAGFPLRESNTN